MAHPTFAKLPAQASEPSTADLDGWKKVSGDPTMKTWVEYKSGDGTLMAGWWAATPGVYHATYTAWEYVHMIKGRITITPDGGTPYDVGPDDCFVVEADFVGTWEIKEEVLKHFVMRS